MDLKELKSLITYANTVIKSGASEITLEVDDIKVTIKADSIQEEPIIKTDSIKEKISVISEEDSTQKVREVVDKEFQEKEVLKIKDSKDTYIEIKSPMIGTFYRKPAPDKETFVNVGDNIELGTVVCVIEAMKLFNEIESEISGKIIKVLIEDGTPVEYDQPLFLVEPS